MKLIDKIKNYFYDEEEVEVKADKAKAEATKTKGEVHTEKKENNVPKEPDFDVISERELFKSDPTFNFPIIFDDEDFKEEKAKKPSIIPPRVEHTKVVERVETNVFKPSLNISPIYGIIDEKKASAAKSAKGDSLLNLYDEKKKVDIDDVLDKVYSQKRVELKNDTYTNEDEITNVPSVNDDLVLDFFNTSETRESKNNDIMDNKTASVDEKLKSIDELLENTDEQDFYSLVDSMYKDEDEEGDK